MIQNVEMYTVKCDNCGKLFQDEHQGYCAWTDKSGAWENASESGWALAEEDTHYCPDCYTIDDEGYIIVKDQTKCEADS